MILGLILWVLSGFLGGGVWVWFFFLEGGREEKLAGCLVGWFLQQFILHIVNEFCLVLIKQFRL